MTLRGRAVQLLLNRVGRARFEQSLALPTTPGDTVFIGDGLALQGAWNEWFPDATVRVFGDEGLLIRDAGQLVAGVDAPRALVLMVGTADLLGLCGSNNAARVAARLDSLVAVAAERLAPASIFVVGVPGRPALGDRASEFNARVASLVHARGATFVPAPVAAGNVGDGFLLSLIRWDATVYAAIAGELARATGLPGVTARPVTALSDIGKGFLVKAQYKRAQLFEALPVPSGRIVLYGDSITEGGSWDGWLPGLPLANRGIGGDTVAQLAARVDSAIDVPLAVSLLAGTNDLQRGEPKDPESIARRFRELVEQIRTRQPAVPILINSVMPRAAKFADDILAINGRYREIATEFDARYLDLWPVLAAPDRSLRKELTPDGLHLNSDGYRGWVSLLGPAIHDMIGKKGSDA